MQKQLEGLRVAILVTDGFEQIELTHPRHALQEEGADVDIVSPMPEEVRGWERTDWGDSFPVDVPLDQAEAADYDALVLPGGRINPDKLRRERSVQTLIRDFFDQEKPVAAICHGSWSLIDAGVVDGKKMTSYHSIQNDLKNAGAKWVDEPVVVDGPLITSRHPEDLEMFSGKIIEILAQRVPAPHPTSRGK